ncbi:MAG: CDP-glycerol glycerophosphotransferase family protein [Promethearchaeota archaeon]
MAHTSFYELILVGSDIKQQKFLMNLKRKSQSKKSMYEIIALDPVSDNSLTNHSIPHKIGNEFLIENREQIEYEVSQWINNWVLKPKINETSIYSNFTYEGESFWWLIEHRIRFEILEICIFIKILQGIQKEKINARKILVYDENDILQPLVLQIFRQDSVNIDIIKPKRSRRLKSLILRYTKRFGGTRYIHLREYWYKLLSKLIFSRYADGKKDPLEIVIFTTNVHWRLCFNPNNNEFEPGNYYFRDIISAFDQIMPGRIAELFKIRNIRRDLSVIKEKRSQRKEANLFFLDTFPIEKKKFKEELKFFRSRNRIFQRKLLLNEDLTFSDVNFASIMKERLLWFIKAYIPLGLRWKAQFDTFISKMNPKVMLFIDEFYTLGRALTLSCKSQKDVLSTALQHGFFTKFTIGTLREEKKGTRDEIEPIILTADLTCVYGSTYQKILIEEGYDKNNTAISGNPGYDQVSDMMNYYKEEEILNQLNLSIERKTIVFGTQPAFYETAIHPLRTLIEVIQNHPNYQLIIKVHPRDKIKRYQQLIEGSRIPISIVKDINIFAVIRICDLFLTQYSTTIIDALAFNKPVAIFNFNEKLNPLSFLQMQAITELKNPKMIIELIPKILEDKALQKQLEVYRNEFLFNQVYYLDGKASTRVVNAILKRIQL